MGDLPRSLKIATVWLLVGLLVFLGVQTLLAERQRSLFTAGPDAIEIRRGADGHYHWPGRIGDLEVDFLVDTGATSTALPLALAERAGLALEGGTTSSTAGGLARGRLARADVTLEGGVRVERLRVIVLPALEAPLLGMDVLSRLHWSQRGGVLRIEAP